MKYSSKKFILSAIHTILTVSILLVIFVGLIFLSLNIAYNSTYVYGKSMQPTLNSHVKNNEEKGDFVLIHKYKDVEVGDIVIATPSWSDKTVIKRLIGKPGDSIRIDKTDTNYELYCNDTLLYSKTINISNTAKYKQFKNALESRGLTSLTLGENEYFIMGDNWADSQDSVSHNLKSVTESQIRGKVDLVVDINDNKFFSLLGFALKGMLGL